MGRSEQDLAALETAAESWIETPWCDDSETKGRGACCHRLVAAVYRDAGWLPGDVSIPSGPALHARGNDRPLMVDWFRGPGAAWFDEVADPMPGDALVIRVGHAPHHLGLLLRGNRVLSVTSRQGVRIIPNASQWFRLLAHAFRPR